MRFPNGRRFAFSIVDDTDNSTVENVAPVYTLLHGLGLRTTKTVWVYPSRDRFGGQSLQDTEYVSFVKDLQARGFEIALHNVGSGSFTREEIVAGVELFHQILGYYPKMHINHASNPDNLYWGAKRFLQPIRHLYSTTRQRGYYGEDPTSPHFWGDMAKYHVKYIRDLTFNGINTLAIDPQMPYRVQERSEYSNYWFSSSDGHTVGEFAALLHPRNVDRLESEGGVCIVYTHFASGFVKNGQVDPVFSERLSYLASKPGWFVPASDILDYLLEIKGEQHPSYPYRVRLQLRWGFERVVKRLRWRR